MLQGTRMAGILQCSLGNPMRMANSILQKLSAERVIGSRWNGTCPCQSMRFMSSMHQRFKRRQQLSVSSLASRSTDGNPVPLPNLRPAPSRPMAVTNLDDPGIFMTPGGRREAVEEIWTRRGDRLVIVDGKAVVYRAYYSASAAFNRATFMDSTSGVHNELDAIFTVVNSINVLAALLELKPTHMLVSFDAAGKNFRHDLLPSYKANRAQTPDAVRQSLTLVKRIIPSMGIQLLEVDGVEADDVIGTMTVRAESAGMEVRIASPDKDFFQLLSENVRCLQPRPRGPGIVLFGPQEFKARYNGIEPSQFVDALALIGDNVDNVPGIHGIGPKFATMLIKEHGSLEVLLENASSVKRQLLREGLMKDGATALLAKKLVSLRTNLPSFMVPLQLSDLLLTPPSDDGKSFQAALDALDMHVNIEAVTRLKRRMQDIWTSFAE